MTNYVLYYYETKEKKQKHTHTKNNEEIYRFA